jgi:hypothetical protein
VFALLLIGAIIGSIPYVPAMYEKVVADATVAGEYVRDDLTVANTLTPSKEDAASTKLRIDAGLYIRNSEACFEEAQLGGQRVKDTSFAIAKLKESLDGVWLDMDGVAAAQEQLTEAWRGIGDEALWAHPTCALIQPMTTA